MHEKKSLIQMARGGFLEIFDLEMSKVLDNILDPNTEATCKRKLTVSFTFAPDAQRQVIGVAFQCTPKLAPINPAVTSLYVAGDDGTGEFTAVEMVPNIPGQINLYGEEQEAPAELKLVRIG